MSKKTMLHITWLGQGGFLFDDGKVRLAIDPYLSDSMNSKGFVRMFPVPISISELAPDLVCCTHDHGDHFDPGTIQPIMMQFPDCLLLGPQSVITHSRELKLDENRLIYLEADSIFEEGGIKITSVPAFHSDPYAIGFIIGWEGINIYISGDTMNNPGLVPAILKKLTSPPDLVFICINGKLGNMDYKEAISVVKQLMPGTAIPMHYGMFAENTTEPEPFIIAVESSGIKGIILNPGETKKIAEII